ncbi:MAG: ABC-2 family transporter protein [Symbiobacteriaceae bacterium]|nr:ABC-2 family transporter protein [Symbiobacteriaceae bacterium]
MKMYLALLRMRFLYGMQYRVAALAGLATQFAWGFMEILAFMAFYRANPANFPMEFSQTVSYIWLQQAFLALFASWGYGADIAETIISGNIAYDLARPLDLYNRWLCEMLATRFARAMLRCLPVLAVAFILPEPMRLRLPASPEQLGFFIVSLLLGTCVVTTYSVLDCLAVFYTMTRINLVFAMISDFLAGAVIPLPFFPEPIRRVVELLPFAAMQNMPLRIYSGHITGSSMYQGVALQLFWLAVLWLGGKWLLRRSLKRVITQGG